MWTATVDSYAPVKVRTSSDANDFASDKCLNGYKNDGDVEELLGSPSPIRARSSSLRSRPPPSARTSALRSKSPNPISRRQVYSSDAAASRVSKEQQWTRDLLNSVSESKDIIGHRLDSSSDMEMYQPTVYNKLGIIGSWRAPVKADHYMSTSLHDSNSGVSSSTSQSPHFTSADVKSRVEQRINRSSSMSHLNRSFSGKSMLLTDEPDCLRQALKEIQSSLENSESQRSVLMQKLQEAQATLEQQSERLIRIESSAKDNSVLVENLKLKEKEYRKIISQLDALEEEKQILQIENVRLREETQNRINALDYQIRSLKSQHFSTESKHSKNSTLLDHATTALSLLEEENSKLQQDKEKLQSEILLLKESFEVVKARYGALEDDSRNKRNGSVKLKEENTALSKQVQEMAGQISELRSLMKAVRDENEHLFSTLKTSTEDKSRSAKQIQGYQETISGLKSRLSATSADRDRLFQEKLDMNSKLQQMMLDKEQLMRQLQAEPISDDQLGERLSHHSYSQVSELKQNTKEIEVAKELNSVKKMKEELSAELTLTKGSYEHALKQIADLDRDKSLHQSQYNLTEQERCRLEQEVNRLTQMCDTQSQERKQDHDSQDEMVHKLRDELQQVNFEKTDLENKFQELTDENTRMKQAAQGSQLSTAESEKLLEEHEKLHLEYSNLKLEYGSLVTKHQQFIINYGHDGEVIEKEKEEILELKKEKDATQKQVAFLQGRILLMESSKKRADEQIFKLTSEVAYLQAQLKDNSKSKSVSPDEDSSLQQEVEILKWQLDKAKEDQKLQKSFIENLRESISEDGKSELQQTKDKQQELLREIEQKDETIKNLEVELKYSTELAEAKQCEVQELSKVVEEMKRENQTLHQDVQAIQNTVMTAPQEPEQETLQWSKSVRTLQEELLEAVQSKKSDSFNRRENIHRSNSLDLQSTSAMPSSEGPEKSSTEDSSHLQSLISKYHTQMEGKETSPQPVVYSLPRFELSKMFSKSWSPVSTASLRRSSASASPLETATTLPAKQEGDDFGPVKYLKPVRKLPPPPPPKPSSVLTKPSIFAPSQQSTSKDSTFNSSTIAHSSIMQSSLPLVSSSTSLSSSGLGQSTFSTQSHEDSQEQSDINVLIHKFDEMAAF